jgi:hypothetical protein
MLYGEDAMLRANDKDLSMANSSIDANDLFVDETIKSLNHFILMEKFALAKESKQRSIDEELDAVITDIFAECAK